MKILKIQGIVIGVLLLSVWVLAQQSPVSFSLRGGYYLPSSSTFNKDYVPVVNNNFNELNTYLTDIGLKGTVQEFKKMTGAAIFGGEFEFKASEQFSLVLGAEYSQKTFTGFLDSSGTIEEVSYEVTEESKFRMSVIPIYGTFRINLPVRVARVYIGGGAGYYLGRIKAEEQWSWVQGSETVDTGTRKTIASGQAVIPHANLGAELKLGGSVTLAMDLRFPFGAIKSFKIKSDTADSNLAGQNLTFVDDKGIEKEFKWEMTGPNLGVNLKIKF